MYSLNLAPLTLHPQSEVIFWVFQIYGFLHVASLGRPRIWKIWEASAHSRTPFLVHFESSTLRKHKRLLHICRKMRLINCTAAVSVPSCGPPRESQGPFGDSERLVPYVYGNYWTGAKMGCKINQGGLRLNFHWMEDKSWLNGRPGSGIVESATELFGLPFIFFYLLSSDAIFYSSQVMGIFDYSESWEYVAV